MRLIIRKWLILAFIMGILGMAEAATNATLDDITDKIDAYLTEQPSAEGFSGAVLIALNNHIIFKKAYGLSNREHQVPNTLQTKFRIGSITKLFTAVALLQLQERGLLNVYDPITHYIPDYPRGDEITIHHILSHTAGIANITEFSYFAELIVYPTTAEKTVSHFKDKPLDFVPGTQFRYSNSGYLLLSYLIEKITGLTYEQVITKNVLIPAGMYHSGLDSTSNIIPNRAQGYVFRDNMLVNAPYIDSSWPAGSGGLYSTVEDLYAFDQALYGGKLISAGSLQQMLTFYYDRYGYGIGKAQWDNHIVIGHDGHLNGFSADFERIDDKLCFIVLSNIQHAHIQEMTAELARIVFNSLTQLPGTTDTTKEVIYNAVVQRIEQTFEHWIAPFASAKTISPILRAHLSSFSCPLLSAVTRTQLFEDELSAAISNLVERSQSYAGHLTWWVTPFAKPAYLAQRLKEQGFSLVGIFPAMVYNIPDRGVIAQEMENIRPIASDQDCAAFNTIVMTAFEFDEEMRNHYFSVIRSDVATQSSVEYYLGFSDGKPVVTGKLIINDGWAGVYDIATLPAERNKGFATQMMQVLLARAQKLGLQSVVLISAPKAVPLYTRLGFEKVFDIEMYGLQK